VFRLDRALIRPGRIDVKAKIDHCSGYQLEQMFLRFYPLSTDTLAREFAKRVQAEVCTVSAAQVQGYFMFHKDRPQDAIDNTKSMVTL